MAEAGGGVPEFTMGDRVRLARRYRGQKISQKELAAAITQAGYPVSPQAIANWEAGTNDIAADKRGLVAIAVSLRTSVSRAWILDGTTGRPTDPGVGKTPAPKVSRSQGTVLRFTQRAA